MHRTTPATPDASLADEAQRVAIALQWRWHALSEHERRDWRAWRAEHTAAAWSPLCRAIIRSGFRRPPTGRETELLWPIVDARPTDAAAWFRTAADPRVQPWAGVLRVVSLRWWALCDAIPPDTLSDWQAVRAGSREAIVALQRIGWLL